MKKQILLTIMCLFSLFTANAQTEQDSIGSEPYMKFVTPYYHWGFPSEGWFHIFEYDDIKFVYDSTIVQKTDTTLSYTWKINDETFCNTENPTFIFIPNNKVLTKQGDSITLIYTDSFIKVAYADLQLIEVADTFRIDIFVEGTFNGNQIQPIQTYWDAYINKTTLGFYHGVQPINFRSVSELTDVKETTNSYDTKKEYFDLFGNKTIAEGLVIEKQNNVYKKKFIVK